MARRRRSATAWGNSLTRMMNMMVGSSEVMTQMMDTALRSARRQAQALVPSGRLAGKGAAARRRASVMAAVPASVNPAPAVAPAARPRRGKRAKPWGPIEGRAGSAGGVRRYELWIPRGTRPRQRLPLLVMLHGCSQDIAAFSASTRMHQLAEAGGFGVLYIEQDRLANPLNCWNWFALNSGKALSEMSIIRAAIRHVCREHPINPRAVSLVGLSAGASMAALLASRYPDDFVAVAMHAGVPPGSARHAVSAMAAMRGKRSPRALRHTGVAELPALLVVQGRADEVVDPCNAEEAVEQWATACQARARKPRTVQRGTRYPMQITDYVVDGRVCARLCQIDSLGHAWSGGNRRYKFSDPSGPDASRLTWSFIASILRQRPTRKLARNAATG